DLDKPNIVVVTGPFQDVAGVAILSNFIDILEPLSSELYVITGKFSDRLNKRIHIIKIKSDEKRELAFIRAIKYIFKQVRTTYNLIKISKNVDTIIFFIGTRIDVLPSLTAKLLGKKTVSIATGSSSNIAESDNVSLFGIGRFFYPRIFRILERVNYSLSDQIIIDSNVESENLIRQFGLAKYRDKIFFGGVLPVDVNFFRINIKLEDRRNVIGYVGRLSQEKGVLNFVKAIPLILKERNDLEFIICGGGGLFEEIKAELKNNGSCDKVTLTGWIPHEKLPDHFNEMKLIVVPSYTETVPYVILEAMACGTPVVASPVAAIPDLIRNGENGFLMESNSPECIANNVIQDLDDPMLDEIVKIAHNLINTEYTYKVVVENYKKNLMKNR
ncbi:Glycosyltransferase involved in cell wall bisynthesis, partial [Candidatus Methanomarinus sp.]